MIRFIVSILLCFLPFNLQASDDIDISVSKGIHQDSIQMLFPSPEQKNVLKSTMIKVAFKIPLDPSSVQKNNIKLVNLSSQNNEHIDGKIAYDPTQRLVTYTPNSPLDVGFYEVEIKSLKAAKAHKQRHIHEIKYHFYVPEVVNGYALPPEPDKKLNDSTLLGIDFNNNGIRDDIERKIVFKYQEPVKIELMFSYARAHQQMLQDPVGSAIESEAKMSRIGDCEMYLINQKVNLGETLEYIEANMYNTKERVKAYLQFNGALSGGVYGSSADDWNAKACDFDVDKLLKAQ